ncbi:hypothetical protein [Streptomyces sp. NRRL S-920]|nr:hypothetical protein [Streptomyces sp. NRRL S-920]
MCAEGSWNLAIATPIGTTKAVFELREQDGALSGLPTELARK